MKPGMISHLSGSDALSLLEIIQNCLTCSTEDDFRELFNRIRRLFQFDFAGSMLGYLDANDSLVITTGLNISFPEEWLQQYLENDYFNLDITTSELIRTPAIAYYSYLSQNHDDIPEKIRKLDMDSGIREFYCHGSPPGPHDKGSSIISFAGHSVRQDKRTEVILECLAPHLHQALNRVACSPISAMNHNKTLSIREKEVLKWLKEGKSSWDISVILGISERTVNYHVYNALEKLDAKNRPQAVAIATSLGLLKLD